MKELKPVLLNEKLIEELALQILCYFKDELYQPLADILKLKIIVRQNSLESELLRALKNDEIAIKGNYIIGKLNAKLSKAIEEAKGQYNKIYKAYYLQTIPTDVKAWISENNDKVNKNIKKILSKIETVDYKNLDNYNISFNNTIGNINSQLQHNIGLNLTFTEQEKQHLGEQYTNNPKLDIKNWAEENIIKMREELNKMILTEGKSQKELKDFLIKEYEVTAKKAVFLARQESSILLSEYSKNKYRQAGVKKFKWSTSNDGRVRDTHEELNGKIFYFDDPPKVKNSKGELKPVLPGMDYNCRCVAIPILDD
jgi:SPP1 gp7 family putative phage head morphogenesis protein